MIDIKRTNFYVVQNDAFYDDLVLVSIWTFRKEREVQYGTMLCVEAYFTAGCVWSDSSQQYEIERRQVGTVHSLQFPPLQACRGDLTDPGVTVMAKDAFSTKGDMVDSLGQKPQYFQIPSLADLLVMYSTYEGNIVDQLL